MEFDISQIKIIILNKTSSRKDTRILVIKNIVLTIINKKKQFFSLTKQKLNQQFSNIRNSVDFLLYHIIDEIVAIILMNRLIQLSQF